MNEDGYQSLAQKVHQNGYHAIPIVPVSKIPSIEPDWRKYCWQAPTQEQVHNWIMAARAEGLGLASGRASVAVDIDARDPAVTAHIAAIATELLGPTPLIRHGRSPRLAMIYRAGEPILSRRMRSLDVIGLGAQLVAFGIHPQTRQRYRWPSGDTPATVPVSQLPAITNTKIEILYSRVATEVFGRAAPSHRLEYDPVNVTPPLSSLTVLTGLLLRSCLFGQEAARCYAKKMLASKYKSTGTGLGVTLVDQAQPLDL